MATIKTLLSNLSILKDLAKNSRLSQDEEQKITGIKEQVTEYEKSIPESLQGDMMDLIGEYKKLQKARSDARSKTISEKELAKRREAYENAKERAKPYYDWVLTDKMNIVNSNILTMIGEIKWNNENLTYEMADVERTLEKILEDSDASSMAVARGRRRTNKKRSTRRKKKRGKKTRNYRTKR